VNEERAKILVDAITNGAAALGQIAQTARRNGKSLRGAGTYAKRFGDEVIKVTKVETLLSPVVGSIEEVDLQEFIGTIAVIKAPETGAADRAGALHRLRLMCEASILPNLTNLSSPVMPRGEAVLPAAVLANAPKYLQRTLLQVNGCYENRWYDAGSVMIRKLLENLIIDVYEKHRRQSEIQTNGEYFMLAGLVTAILTQDSWSLQRETKRTLPDIKKLGDRAAHNRRYEATRQDIDAIRSGLRAAIDDLLHLAGHK
jgi:hypothetical protein